MVKNKLKIVVLLTCIIIVISTLSFVTYCTTPGENARTNDVEPISNTIDNSDNLSQPGKTDLMEDIHNGDLYLFGFDITMDKLVDGNVFIFANNVNITGKVNGSLFICANTVTFSENSYITQTIYTVAREVVLNGLCQDLYVTANKVDMNYNSFTLRDLRVSAKEFNFSGGVGRDAFVNADTFNFITDASNSSMTIIYGNLSYRSNNELDISKNFVQGDINYTPLSGVTTTVVLTRLFELLSTLLFVGILVLIFNWLTPKFVESSKNYISVKAFKTFGVGLLSIIISLAVVVLLVLSIVGAQLGVIVFDLVSLMITLAFAITVLSITYAIKNKFKFNKKYLTFITVVVITLILWALHQIPYVGIVVSIITSIFGFGIIVDYLLMKHKENKSTIKDSKKVVESTEVTEVKDNKEEKKVEKIKETKTVKKDVKKDKAVKEVKESKKNKENNKK